MLRSKDPVRGALFGLAATLFLTSCSDSPDLTHGESYPAIFQDTSPPLREMVKVAPAFDFELFRADEAEPPQPIPRPHEAGAAKADPAIQNHQGTAQIATTSANFEGGGAGLAGFSVQSAPPDTDGDVGPNHYVQIVNQAFTIFNKSGTVVMGPSNTNTLWNGFPGNCATTNDGDGVVRYDRIADRWVIAQFSVNGGSGPFFQCIAVSTTNDPTGTYNRYAFSYEAFNDYPKVGLWPDAYYFTFNMFPNNSFAGARVCAMDRAKMLTGAAATMQCFNTPNTIGGALASDLDGATLPPAGSPNYVLALGENANELAFWKLHVDFTTPANSTFTGPTTIPTAAFTSLGQVTQPSGGTPLDSLSDRLMNRFAYRNFGDHEALVVTHSVVAGSGGGVRWYEIRSPGTTPTIFQQGTYAPDSGTRWMGSIAMDKSGDIAIGFSLSGSTVSPSVHYTARLPTDAAGTFGQGEGTIIAGSGVQNGGLSRWGDYSSMNIDPTDDCTFWFTEEYMAGSGSFNWHTRIASFKLANCGGTTTNDFTISPNPQSRSISAGNSTTYAVNTTVLSGSAQQISLSISGLPTGVTASFNPTTITAGGSSTLTVNTATTTAAGTSNLTITGTGASATHTTSVALTVSNNNNPPTVNITSPTNNSTVSGTVSVAATASDSDGTVASVKFDLPDGTSVTKTASPFSTTWNSTTVTDGSGYQIVATATDDKGATATSTVNITVHNGTTTCINGTFNAKGLPKQIPDNSTRGITSSDAVTGTGNVGTLRLQAHITHTFIGDLKVTLTSPAGTKFVAWNRQGGSTDNLSLDVSPTVFHGEVAAGTWKLKVQDLATIDTGTLDSWSLSIVGDCSGGGGTDWSASEQPNVPTVDNGQVCRTINVTTSSGNAADAKLDISGIHDFRSILKGTLAHGGKTVDAFPVGTFPTGQGSFSLTSRAVAGFTGSASGAWTFCLVDTDAFGDTGTLQSWSVHN
jgi:subtilisin-like proprotein convertase family protein